MSPTPVQHRSYIRRVTAVLTVVVLMGGAAETASATLLGARSDANGVEVNVSAVSGLLGLSVGPSPVASGVAPGLYHQSATLASLTGNTLGIASLSTAILSSNADSNVDGGFGSRLTSAAAEVNGLGLRIVPGVITPDLIHLSANTIRSSAQVSGDVGTLSAVGGFFIEGLTLNVAGVGNITVDANAAPNTVLLDALGIRIVANEQIFGGDGLTSRSLTTNALHISISSLANVVGGDVVIAHSFAEMTVPAPGPSSCAVLTVCALGARRRRR